MSTVSALLFILCKQKTAYDMRISDWSSDVCSSDLRAERLVNWSPVLQTGISDLEVDHKEVDGELVSMRFGSLNDDEPHVIVATTRVETMLGDTAVAEIGRASSRERVWKYG